MRWSIWQGSLILAIACFALAWSIVQMKRRDVILGGCYQIQSAGAGLVNTEKDIEERSLSLLQSLKGTPLVPAEIEAADWNKVLEHHGVASSSIPMFRKYPPNSSIILDHAQLRGFGFRFWAPLKDHHKISRLLPPVEKGPWEGECRGSLVLAFCIWDRWFGLGEGMHWTLNQEGVLEPTYTTGILFGVTDRYGPDLYVSASSFMQPPPDPLGVYASGHSPPTMVEMLKSGRATIPGPAYVPLFLLLYSTVMLGYLLWRPLSRVFRLRRR